jgi:hypothetical protein
MGNRLGLIVGDVDLAIEGVLDFFDHHTSSDGLTFVASIDGGSTDVGAGEVFSLERFANGRHSLD